VAGCAKEEHGGGERARVMVLVHGEMTGRCFSRCTGGGVPEEGAQMVEWVRWRENGNYEWGLLAHGYRREDGHARGGKHDGKDREWTAEAAGDVGGHERRPGGGMAMVALAC